MTIEQATEVIKLLKSIDVGLIIIGVMIASVFIYKVIKDGEK
jgi:hypothetical protein